MELVTRGVLSLVRHSVRKEGRNRRGLSERSELLSLLGKPTARTQGAIVSLGETHCSDAGSYCLSWGKPLLGRR
jgi:hypothetical protein